MRDRKSALKFSVPLLAMAVLLFLMPFSPGCFCVEDTTLGPVDSIAREYEGYIVREDNGQAILFRVGGLWERSEGIEGTISLPGDTTAEYELEDVHVGNRVLTFTVTIPTISNLPLNFEASFDRRFLAGTFERAGGTYMGRLIAVSVVGVTDSDFDITGAYELVTSSTNGDTLANEYPEELSVRLEFNRDGSFRTVSKLLPDGNEVVETGDYSVMDSYLFIFPDRQTGERQLPFSVRGFVVNKDLMILASLYPFPSFDGLIPVDEGIQVEHFKQTF